VNERSRFWLVSAAALATVVLTAALGRWQLGRASQKEALAAQIAARAELPVLDARALPQTQRDEAWLHRRVQAQGQWLAAYTVYLENRQMNGRVGFYVLTPLRLGDGRVLLVQRGWAPRDFADRSRLPRVHTPEGPVQVQGRLIPEPSRLYELGDAQQGPIRQNLDWAQFRLQTGLPLLPYTLLQTGAASEGLQRDWPAIDTGVDKHYGYAFQWFGLSVLIAILYVWFQFIRPRRGVTNRPAA
jgi:surfeit locus 1 family protein